jgi:putative hemolysin
MKPDPFRLSAPGALQPLARLAETLSGLAALAAGYARRPADAGPAEFLRFALRHLDTEAVIDPAAWAQLPTAGPLIVYANHPHGGGEGLLLADLLLQRRADLRILANRLLCRVPEVAPLILPINVFRGGVNQRSLRAALRHLEAGGALLVFPAGEVSRWDWRRRAYADPPWQDAVSLLARRSRARLQPVRVGGRAPMLSILLGALHPRLRTLRLPRDLLALQGRRIPLQLGAMVTPQAFAAVPPEAQTGLLRLLVEQIDQPWPAPTRPRPLPPLIAAAAPQALAAEIAALPPENRLLQQGGFEVWCADAPRLALTLPELGRLRELSFRAMGEGSGEACDLDAFDAHYQHLFVWSPADRAVVGAYRIGDVQAIVARLGVAGLYTHQLFDYGPALPRHLGAALELGRSFVAPAYQRSFQPLRLLWSGIAVLLRRRPELGWLFGPVSVPPGQGPMARALLRDTLMLHHSDPVLARMVRARQPLRASQPSPERRSVIAGLADPARLSRALSLLDRSQQGLPVLVRQYLELKGRFAGFHVDESFGGSLDGLVFVEVAQIPERVMQRMTRVSPAGRGGAQAGES